MSRARIYRHRSVSLALLGALALPAVAAVPPTGLVAEAAGQWNAAADIYRRELAQSASAEDAALWTRLGEVEARAAHADAAASAYARAADLVPGDAEAQRNASRAFAVAQQPKPALDYLERAIALRPDDDALKLDRVKLANWLGDYALSERTLDELLAKDAGRVDISADLGRVRAWQGRLDEADELFALHLEAFPDDRLAWIDRSRIAIWRGDYAGAIEQLDQHDEKFSQPPDTAAASERARALAWAGRWRAAQALNAELRAEEADNYDEVFTEALLHRHHHRPVDAVPWLERVQALKPEAKETRDLSRGTWLPLRSRIGLDAGRYEDSADILIEHVGVRGAWRFGAAAWLRVEAQRRSLSAPEGSRFAPVTGGSDVEEERAWLGLGVAPDPSLSLGLRIGRSHLDRLGRFHVFGTDGEFLEESGSATIWRGDLDWRAGDAWLWRLDAGRDRVAASPLSISLDLTRRWVGAAVEWRPDLRWRGEVRVEHGRYGGSIFDANRSLTLDVAAWRAMYRSQSWQWDLGGVALWQDFDENTVTQGYYAPDSYRRLQAAARGYWRWTDDHGLALDLATGVQRDENSGGWKSASDISAEAVFGIFSDWELRLRAAYSDRRQASGNFDGRSFGASLEYRF